MGRPPGRRSPRVLLEVEPTERLPVWPWNWLDVDAAHLSDDADLRGWVARAREAAERHVDRARPPLGLVHGDPNPQKFLVDDSGDVAVVEWASTQHGPLLYDLAFARWFAESESVFDAALDGYVDSIDVDRSTAGLGVFLRYRDTGRPSRRGTSPPHRGQRHDRSDRCVQPGRPGNGSGGIGVVERPVVAPSPAASRPPRHGGRRQTTAPSGFGGTTNSSRCEHAVQRYASIP